MALHEQAVGATDEWYTPPYVFTAMNATFDMDVASPGQNVTPWIPARSFIMAASLRLPWQGFIWMNPPFGGRNGLVPWLDKFVNHNNGVALVPDRTSAPWFQTYVRRMDAFLFVTPKIRFIDRHGNEGVSPAQGTCLCAKGERGLEALINARHLGLLARVFL